MMLFDELKKKRLFHGHQEEMERSSVLTCRLCRCEGGMVPAV